VKSQYYDRDFYNKQQDGSLRSAQVVVPIVTDCVQPKSVVDIGCGVGTWLSCFDKLNLDILGLDGEYVDKKMLKIDSSKFLPANLENRIQIDRKFDLAVCLEVLEHLPPHRTETFIEDLTKLSDVILFSCAIPGQGGTNHINELWQSECVEIFQKYKYVGVDYIRPLIWVNNDVEFWYKQNIILFCKANSIEEYSKLRDESGKRAIWDIVHPEIYKIRNGVLQRILNKKIVKIILAARRFLKKHIAKLR
jgi:SAM-dependent methyltransferase